MGATGNGNALTFVGLELTALETPSLESPPTNSLPPLRWPPRRDGVMEVVSSGVCGGVVPSCRPEVSEALKVKLGSVEAVLLCAPNEDSGGGRLICIDAGLLFTSSPLILRLGGCIGKWKSGLATISILGPPGITRGATVPAMLKVRGARSR
jgi:hypothetical protein